MSIVNRLSKRRRVEALVKQSIENAETADNYLSTFPDYNTRSGSLNGNCNKFQGSLDNNLRDTRFGKSCIQVLPDLSIFDQFTGKIFSAIPVRVPPFYYA